MTEEVGSYLECIFSKRFQERKKEREARKKRIADGEEEVPMSVVEFLDAVEEPLKDAHIPQVGQKKRWVKKNIPQGKGHFIYTSLLGTAADLSTAENVQVSQNILLCSTRC